MTRRVTYQTIEFQTGNSDVDDAKVASIILYAKKLGITEYARDSFEVVLDKSGNEIR